MLEASAAPPAALGRLRRAASPPHERRTAVRPATRMRRFPRRRNPVRHRADRPPLQLPSPGGRPRRWRAGAWRDYLLADSCLSSSRHKWARRLASPEVDCEVATS